MFKTKFLSLSAAFLMAAAVLVPGARAEDTTLTDIVSKGELTAAVFAGAKPLSFVDPSSGEIEGFAPDLIRLYGKKLGVEVKLVNYDWSGLFPALLTKKVDVVAANVTTTMPRTASLGLAGFWMFTGARVAVAAGAPYTKLSDLNQDGVVIAVTRGSNYVKKIADDFPKATVKQFETLADVVQAVQIKRATGFVADQLVVEAGIRGREDAFSVIPETYVPQTYSFATRPEDVQMQRSLDIFFRLIKLSGEYQALYKKWFGVDWKPLTVGY